MTDEITYIFGHYNCDNCGAYAETIAEIKHYTTCKPYESKRWEKYYNDEPQD